MQTISIIFLYARETFLMLISEKFNRICMNLSCCPFWNFFGVHTACFATVRSMPGR